MTERVPRVLKSKHCASFNVLDPFGHMSTQHYLTFFLEHRWVAYREQLGMSMAELAKLPFIFVARKVGIEFLQPVFGDEEFEITSKVVRVAEVETSIACEMRKANGKLAATCEMSFVTISKETKRPTPPTPEFLDLLYEK